PGANPAAGPAEFTREDSAGMLSVTLGRDGSLRNCTAPPEWVSWQRAGTLRDAFARALHAARADRSRAELARAPTDPVDRLDRLYWTALANLHRMPRLAEVNEGDW